MLITQFDIKPILGGVQKNLSFSTLEPFIAISEHRFVDEFGQALYNYLAGSPPQQVLELAKSLILWQAYSIAQPHIHVKVGDAGMAKNMPANTVQLTKWEYLKLEESNLSMLDFFFEAFYKALDTAEPPITAYTNSASYTTRTKLLISTAHQYTQVLPSINGSSRMFSKLKPYIALAQSQLTDKLTAEAITQLVSGQDYSNHIYKHIATMALYEALPYISVLIDTEGIRVVVKTDSTRNELQAQATDRAELRRKLYNDAKTALEALTAHLFKTSSPTVLPDFYNTFVKDSKPFNQTDDLNASPIL